MLDKIIRYGLICAVSLLVVSCEKKEPLWDLPPAKAGEVIKTFDLGPDYENVIYYQLSTQNIQSASLLSWDIALATGTDEHHIRLNGGKDVQVYNTNDTTFDKTTFATTKVAWQWDAPNGDKDSTAVGNWLDSINQQVSANKVYIFDLSKTSTPRYKKVKFVAVSSTEYTIKVANLDNTDAYETKITKDPSINFVHFNFITGQAVPYEPPSDAWDLVFTRYRYLYYDQNPVFPYLVNGVLINTRHISVAQTSTLKYDDIDAAKAASLLLTRKEDEIGFDWKTYTLDAGKYTVSPDSVYILKDNSGAYYKFHFVDFYNEQGVKGFPKFTYQRL